MHVRAQPDTYDLKVQADIRKFFFKPLLEQRVLEKLKSFLWSYFNKLYAQVERVNRYAPETNDKKPEEEEEPENTVITSLLQKEIGRELPNDSLIGPKEKQAILRNQINIRASTGAGRHKITLLKYLEKNELKIKKLLPAPQQANSQVGAASQPVNFYSKVAEVNEQGELSGDETTQSGTSDNSDDEEEEGKAERLAKSLADSSEVLQCQKPDNDTSPIQADLQESPKSLFSETSDSNQSVTSDILASKNLYSYFAFSMASEDDDILRVRISSIDKFIKLMQEQMNSGLTERQILRGNLLPTDGIAHVRKKRSFLKRLGNDFSEKLSMISNDGKYYDHFMRDLPNRLMRSTFKKREFKKIKVVG